jgi:TIR domain
MTKHFDIALSFPGEHREFVLEVAESLAAEMTRDRVFYDEWHEVELLGTAGDLKLISIYENAILVVPFFSRFYGKRWCSMEWEAIRGILLNRRKDDAVIPVHIDDTEIPGWSAVNFGIRLRGRAPQEIADIILQALQKIEEIRANLAAPSRQEAVAGKVPPTFNVVGADVQPPPIRRLLRELERALAVGDLQDSELGPDVLVTLRDERDVELAKPLDPLWLIAAIRAADSYFTLIRLSAGQRDWQRDFAKAATPILVGMAWSLERSADAQAVVLRLCDVIAKRLRLKLIWPADADEGNDLANAIYRECLDAGELECDRVLVELQGLTVIGPA